ncbi:MAG: glutamate--tRNA ligase [Acidobacteriota bacterium]|nr:glutamate--tRNA ligase [Acidobacteriota bacterium]MDQ5839029.1 glutamate--tRNA ligase [Acidobacteriota bacterium]
MSVRVRFAPSPTGYLHIGAARTALFNWLYARKMGGKFLLRIEDTDLQRSTEESTRSILEGLAWLGIGDYDEEIVFQSQNADKHRAAATRLIEDGKAYRDFTPKEERSDANVKQEIAERARGRATAEGSAHRSNPYRDLPLEESDRRAAAGEPFAVRLKVPREGRSRFEDVVYGEQVREYSEIEDLVLLRSDGHPLYNLSVVCDDIEMGITDVIRGQDHLTNTHKQILIYEALGAPVPQFAHLPLILAPGGKKLSKRIHGPIVSLTTYRDAGFIPAAFRNFLALLGWAPSAQFAADLISGDAVVKPHLFFDEKAAQEGKEIFTLQEMIEVFDLGDIHRSPAIFNFDANNPKYWTDNKALWMNAEYIHTMPLDELTPMIKAELESAGLWKPEYESTERAWFERTVDLIRQRFHTLKDFSGQGRAYLADDFEFDPQAVAKNLKKEPRLKELLPHLADALEKVEPWTTEEVEATLRAFAEESGVKAGLLINASRTALTGQSVGPSMFDVFDVIGRPRSVERLRDAARLV